MSVDSRNDLAQPVLSEASGSEEVILWGCDAGDGHSRPRNWLFARESRGDRGFSTILSRLYVGLFTFMGSWVLQHIRRFAWRFEWAWLDFVHG